MRAHIGVCVFSRNTRWRSDLRHIIKTSCIDVTVILEHFRSRLWGSVSISTSLVASVVLCRWSFGLNHVRDWHVGLRRILHQAQEVAHEYDDSHLSNGWYVDGCLFLDIDIKVLIGSVNACQDVTSRDVPFHSKS